MESIYINKKKPAHITQRVMNHLGKSFSLLYTPAEAKHADEEEMAD